MISPEMIKVMNSDKWHIVQVLKLAVIVPWLTHCAVYFGLFLCIHWSNVALLNRVTLFEATFWRLWLHGLCSLLLLDFDLIWAWASDRILDDNSFLSLLLCLDSSAILPAIAWLATLKNRILNLIKKVLNFWTWKMKIEKTHFFIISSTSLESLPIS